MAASSVRASAPSIPHAGVLVTMDNAYVWIV